jgi:uncharacterized membrane protein YkvA (DUF1232 family)
MTSERDDGRADFYQALRGRLRDWAQSRAGRDSRWTEYLLFAPDLFHLLIRLAADPEVPAADKAKLGALIAYFVSPVDLMPEMLFGPVGYLDDVALTAWVLHNLLSRDERIQAVARRHWAGEQDVLAVIQRILGAADAMIGTGLWNRLRRRFR